MLDSLRAPVVDLLDEMGGVDLLRLRGGRWFAGHDACPSASARAESMESAVRALHAAWIERGAVVLNPINRRA